MTGWQVGDRCVITLPDTRATIVYLPALVALL